VFEDDEKLGQIATNIANKYLGLNKGHEEDIKPLIIFHEHGFYSQVKQKFEEESIDRNIFNPLLDEIETQLNAKYFEFCSEIEIDIWSYSDLLELYATDII